MLEFGGAKGSNTGDAFHELWAVRQALRMLDAESKLVGITLEGLCASDEGGVEKSRWLGVDCGLYYDDEGAERLDAQQLKYSGADSKRPWTIARVCAGKTDRSIGAGSVIRRLADVYRGWVIEKKRAADSLSISLVAIRPAG
ncbi:MAG: hypothetical protein AB1942_22445 [Pseudomonadota bacterium]